MKYLLLLLTLMIVGCTDRPDKPAPPPPPHDALSCKGEFKEVTRYKFVVKCDDGKIVEYSTYKYPFYRNGVWQ